MSLYYGIAQGPASFSTWQMGLYMKSDVLTPTAVWNTWQAAMFQFFQVGSLHAFGYSSFQAPSHKTDRLFLYEVDEATDRKSRIQRAVVSWLGTSTEPGVPTMCAPYCLLTPAVTVQRRIGRLYLPPISASAVTTNTVTLAKQQQIRDFLHDAFNEMTGNLLFPVIRDRQHHTSMVATKCRVSNIFASVPSRNLRGGNDPKYESTTF